jgi:hypothetical protein
MAIAKKSAITADIFGAVLTLTFANGQEITVDAAKLSDSIRNEALMHGLKQKLVDAAAIARNIETGQSATVADKFEAVKKVADRITRADGTWNIAAGTGERTPKNISNVFLRALMKVTGRDADYTKAFLENKTKEQRDALKKNPAVLAAMAELQAATVSNGINSSALLAELGMEPTPDEPVAQSEPVEVDPTALVITPNNGKPNTRTSKKKLVPTTA